MNKHFLNTVGGTPQAERIQEFTEGAKMNGYTKEITEEQRLQNILASCDEQLKSEPGNQWWANFRLVAQEKLEAIYEAQYMDDFVDDMSDLRLQEAARVCL